PPETATKTASPPWSNPWRRMAARTRSARLSAMLTLRLEPHPDLAVLEVFLLPHRYRLLQRVDGEVARLEGLAAMGRRDGDHHARLADLEPPHAMHERQPRDVRPPDAHRRRDLPHLGLGHRRVGLVLEELHPAPARLIPHHPRE